MSTTTTTTTWRGWATRDEIAAKLKIQPRRVDELRKLLPPDKQRREGRAVLIDFLALVEIWAERKAAVKAKRRKDLTDEEGEVDGPETSEALERWRTAKADLAEHELATKRGQMVEVEDLRRAMDALTAGARLFAERLAARHGQAAADAFNAWLETAAASIVAAGDA